MKKMIMLLAFPLFLWGGQAVMAQQAEGSYLVSGGLDLARTDAPGVIKRYQIGLEANYFHWYNISFSGGYEFNYNRPNQVTLGGRYYPLEPAFLRVRGLIGKDSDVAIGAGYTVNLSYRVRLEGMVDYYAVTNVAGLRAAIGILIN
ncbi:hypothetical protein DN752_12735 [Echinicola strongylocentroti]|uniref:Outer membrane protein beta-barrel domain-containing protein n=1 Tax=Echinicola strongylocentroti TaxID=1795355 RepID=A0A2Z4IIZ3_9BACT|nr:hypothetical protein [Echinicola strongylocentroti]AWW30924.1 hypothetical protein DN752_12735 [Echinicola strongylocentroti]